MGAWFDYTNLILNGLTAIGTVGAVIVSLWLSMKTRLNFKVQATTCFIGMGNGIFCLTISVVNLGDIPIRLGGGFCCKISWFKKKFCWFYPPTYDFYEAKLINPKLPLILKTGEHKDFFFDIQKWKKDMLDQSGFPKWVKSSFPQLIAKSIKVGVSTGVKNRFFKLDPALLEIFKNPEASSPTKKDNGTP